MPKIVPTLSFSTTGAVGGTLLIDKSAIGGTALKAIVGARYENGLGGVTVLEPIVISSLTFA